MTILQEGTFGGVEANGTRPGSIVDNTTMHAIAKGQAFAYEATTGLAVPNAGSALATAHNHDATNGAPIRTPLAQGWLNAHLHAIPSDDLSVTPGWQPFLYGLVFVPEGFTEVSVLLVGEGIYVPQTVRAVLMDESTLVDLESPVHVERIAATHHFAPGNAQAWQARLQANEGEWHVLRLEAWAAKSLPGAADDDEGPFMEGMPRFVDSWHVLPVDQAPVAVAPAEYTEASDDPTISLDADFVSFDDGELDVDEGLDAYALKEMNANTGRLHELITGRARGLQDDAGRLFEGHSHADDGASDLDDSGVLVDTALGSWAYGVVRRLGGVDTNRASYDEVAAAATISNSWSGNIFAPLLLATTSNITASFHHFRLPKTKRTHLTGTSKVKYAVLIWKGDTSTTTVGVAVGDDDFGVADTESTQSSTTAGRVLLTGEVDAEIDGLATSTQEAALASVRLRIQNSLAKTKNVAIYGMALALEA